MSRHLKIRRQDTLNRGIGKKWPPHFRFIARSRSRLYLGYPRFDSAHPRQKVTLSREVRLP